jgi:hypothetical protein
MPTVTSKELLHAADICNDIFMRRVLSRFYLIVNYSVHVVVRAQHIATVHEISGAYHGLPQQQLSAAARPQGRLSARGTGRACRP